MVHFILWLINQYGYDIITESPEFIHISSVFPNVLSLACDSTKDNLVLMSP